MQVKKYKFIINLAFGHPAKTVFFIEKNMLVWIIFFFLNLSCLLCHFSLFLKINSTHFFSFVFLESKLNQSKVPVKSGFL